MQCVLLLSLVFSVNHLQKVVLKIASIPTLGMCMCDVCVCSCGFKCIHNRKNKQKLQRCRADASKTLPIFHFKPHNRGFCLWRNRSQPAWACRSVCPCGGSGSRWRMGSVGMQRQQPVEFTASTSWLAAEICVSSVEIIVGRTKRSPGQNRSF